MSWTGGCRKRLTRQGGCGMTLIYDQYDEVLAVNDSLRKQLGHLRDVLVKCEAERAVQLARSESLQQLVEHFQSVLVKWGAERVVLRASYAALQQDVEHLRSTLIRIETRSAAEGGER